MSVINTNLNALVAQASSSAAGTKLSTAMERLSTGLKINSAKDDAAGLAISNRMTSQIRGYAKAIQNTNDAISMTQTAEGAYGNVNGILQRMRELAVQASSATNSDSDRQSLQLEVAQLKDQIDSIASSTNFNNIKLLNGTAQKLAIQTGVKAGETMNIGFASVQTKDIGIGSKAVLASTGGQYVAGADFSAFTAGTLTLNGVAVGASMATDDNASYATATVKSVSASAIAKAAAINRVATSSGVYAKADTNSVSGAAMASAATSVTGTITINGVATDTITTSTDNSLSRKLVVNAINAKSAQTGVVATDTGDDKLGVTLAAADGRNITVAYNGGMTSTASGVKAAGTFVGSYDLFTLDGRSITVDSKAGTANTLKTSGLVFGTYSSDTAIATTYARASTTGVPLTSTTGLLNSSSLIINGIAIGQALTTEDLSSDVTATSSTRASSAIAIAAAINRSSAQTGVTATATENILRGSSYTAATTAGQLFLNGQTITINNNTRNGVIDSINAYSGKTGVVASAWGEGMQLVAADGRNISISSSVGAASLGLTGLSITAGNGSATGATTFTSQVSLSSENAFTIKAGITGVPNLEKLGFRQGTYGGSDNGLKVNKIDITSSSGATQALVAIDAAIDTVSKAQAASGAYNNRLDSVITNLTESNQNISAARSRITDTDYAVETTNLAKQQIISQAATAMLAQANQQGQTVLSLLK